MNTIKLSNIFINYDKKNILKNINFDAKSNEIIYLQGKSGSGKTSLFKTISGLTKPESGQLYLFNKQFGFNYKKETGIIDKIGFYFQDISEFNFKNNVLDEILFGIEMLDKLEKMKRLNSLLQLFEETGLNNILKRSLFSLSFGETALVKLAAVLIKQPSILLLDEPFSNYEDDFLKVTLKILTNYVRTNECTLIFTSHKSIDSNFYNRVVEIRSNHLYEVEL